MATATKSKRSPGSKKAGIGDEAVKAATGKTWSDWCKLLDKDGCRKKTHKEIAALVHDKYGTGPWWGQMVAVGYEQARGLRRVHQTPRGWQASVSRTLHVPVSRLYGAWANAATRKKWMGGRSIVVRKATKNKSMRISCPNATSVEVNFYGKGDGKSQVTVQHCKLKREADVPRSKRYWAAVLDRLKERLADYTR